MVNEVKENIVKLKECLKKKENEEFYKQIEVLSKFVDENAEYSIENAITELLEIVETKGVGKEYLEKLEYISSIMSAKYEPYIPISKNFSQLYKEQKKTKGVSFLCPELNKRTGGIVNGTLSVIMGCSGSMKTTYSVNLCYNAIKNGKNVLYLSLEETPFQLYSKLLSRVSMDVNPQKGLQHKDIIQHNLSEMDEEYMFEKVSPYLEELKGNFLIAGESELANYDFMILESKIKEIDQVMKQMSKEKNGEENHGIDILVVDHIQLLKYADSSKDPISLINTYVSFFRKQSLNFLHQKREVIVILLAQANREGIAYSKKHDGSYLIQHIDGASEIERSASYVISVYSDAECQVSKMLKVGALKLRGAQLPLDTISIPAEGTYYKVESIEDENQQDYDMADILDINNFGDNTNNKVSMEILEEFDQ